MARKTPMAHVKILFSAAAGRCSFPNCRMNLVLEVEEGDKKQIGKIAHIVAHSSTGPKKGPRADSSYPQEKLDTYDNWILLCGTHHDIVDNDEGKYTVEVLREMKKDHEAWVTSSLEKEMVNIGFAELEIAAAAISSAKAIQSKGSFDVLPPAEKIDKNNLTERTYHLITMGLSRSRVVGDFIENQSKLDENYPERLKKGFRDEYDKLVKDGVIGDALFQGMIEFSSGNNFNFERSAAGLAILTHLFEICEVFEK